MNPGADEGTVASPCTSVCVIDAATGFCGGCFRTLEEIAGWIDFSAAERREVITTLGARRSKFSADVAARMDSHAER